MVTVSRRVLVIAGLAFWMGGFTFYAAVVVPVGQDVLGSHRIQGFVTRRVTDYLNLAGAMVLPALAWDIAASRVNKALGRQIRWAAWVGMVATLGVLVWLHACLDDLLTPESFIIRDADRFYVLHRWYSLASTVQWGFAVAYACLTVQSWREEDRDAMATSCVGPPPPSPQT